MWIPAWLRRWLRERRELRGIEVTQEFAQMLTDHGHQLRLADIKRRGAEAEQQRMEWEED